MRIRRRNGVEPVNSKTVSRASTSPWSRNALPRIVINAFLIFHLIAIACWAVPISSPLLDAFRGFVRPYMLWSGLFQSWDMFAPLPKSENDYIQAVVITHDGQVHTWKFPRMEQLSLLRRYSKERYRKFAENLEDSKNSVLWPDVSRHLARLYQSPANPPEIVMLIRYWSEIVPPSNRSHASRPEQAQIFSEYNVKPEDLR